MSRDELKARCDELGIEYARNATDEKLQELIAEAEAASDDVDEAEVEEGAEAEEEESEEGSDDEAEEESDESEEGSDEEGAESEVKTEDATGEVTRYGVYRGNSSNCVAVYTQENHGLDFKKLAEAKAKQLSEGGIDHEARPFVDPAQPEVDKNVVNIVNKNNNLVRQYTLVTHGKDYRELAEAFIEKYGEKKGLHIQE